MKAEFACIGVNTRAGTGLRPRALNKYTYALEKLLVEIYLNC